MALKLVETLKESIEELDRLGKAEPPCEAADGVGALEGVNKPSAEIVDLSMLRARHSMAHEVDPATVLKLALEDVASLGNVTRCYITLITDDPDGGNSAAHYRCGMTKPEEVAFRQLGLAEAIDSWRG